MPNPSSRLKNYMGRFAHAENGYIKSSQLITEDYYWNPDAAKALLHLHMLHVWNTMRVYELGRVR